MHHNVHNMPSLWNDRLAPCSVATPQRGMSEGPATPNAIRSQCQWYHANVGKEEMGEGKEKNKLKIKLYDVSSVHI